MEAWGVGPKGKPSSQADLFYCGQPFRSHGGTETEGRPCKTHWGKIIANLENTIKGRLGRNKSQWSVLQRPPKSLSGTVFLSILFSSVVIFDAKNKCSKVFLDPHAKCFFFLFIYFLGGLNKQHWQNLLPYLTYMSFIYSNGELSY